MILIKISISLLFICFLNGCIQGTAFLGSAYTLVSTGNIYQTSLTYGSSKAIKKITGKTPTENIKSFIDSKNTIVEGGEESYDEFFVLANKGTIKKKSKALNLANR